MTEPFDRQPDEPAEAPLADLPAGQPTPPLAAGIRARRRIGSLQLAIVVVALLAGSALFLSGYSLGARTATTPGTPTAEADLFAPFWDVYESIQTTSGRSIGRSSSRAPSTG